MKIETALWVGSLEGQPCELDPCEVLGVTKDAPLEVVRSAFKKIAKRHHTDKTNVHTGLNVDPFMFIAACAAYSEYRDQIKKRNASAACSSGCNSESVANIQYLGGVGPWCTEVKRNFPTIITS